MTQSSEESWKVSQQIINQHKQQFIEFLDEEYEGSKVYSDLIDNAIENHKKRIIINLEHLREYDRQQKTNITNDLIQNPREYTQSLTEAVNDFAERLRLNAPKDFHVGVTGPIGDHLVTPRGLSSRFI